MEDSCTRKSSEESNPCNCEAESQNAPNPSSCESTSPTCEEGCSSHNPDNVALTNDPDPNQNENQNRLCDSPQQSQKETKNQMSNQNIILQNGHISVTLTTDQPESETTESEQVDERLDDNSENVGASQLENKEKTLDNRDSISDGRQITFLGKILRILYLILVDASVIFTS